MQMKRVTGIGGIFFQAKDPSGLRAWYKARLGIDVQDCCDFDPQFVKERK
jgi:hypothetical protein